MTYGTRKGSREYWDSGLKVQEYSELKELPYESVRRWICWLKKERSGDAKVNFVEVKAPSAPIVTGQKVLRPDSYIPHVFDRMGAKFMEKAKCITSI